VGTTFAHHNRTPKARTVIEWVYGVLHATPTINDCEGRLPPTFPLRREPSVSGNPGDGGTAGRVGIEDGGVLGLEAPGREGRGHAANGGHIPGNMMKTLKSEKWSSTAKMGMNFFLNPNIKISIFV